MMSKDEIRLQVCEVLRAIQTDSGLETPELTDDIRPLGLPGFDSLATVDAEVRLSEALGVELDHLPFKSPQTGEELTIGEIVTHLVERYGREASAPGPEKQQ